MPGAALPAGAEASEWPLDQVAQLGDDEGGPEQEQHGDAEIAEQVLGQAEEAEHRTAGQCNSREGEDHPGDDRQRPQFPATSGSTPGHGRQHWQGTRRQAGYHPRQEPDPQ